jgi:hypothetical protein
MTSTNISNISNKLSEIKINDVTSSAASVSSSVPTSITKASKPAKIKLTTTKTAKLNALLGKIISCRVCYNSSRIQEIRQIVGYTPTGNSVYTISIPLIHERNVNITPGFGGGVIYADTSKIPPVPTVAVTKKNSDVHSPMKLKPEFVKYLNNETLPVDTDAKLYFTTNKTGNWSICDDINTKYRYHDYD